MSSAREEILARVRRALADCPPVAPVPRDYALTTAEADPVALFAARVAEYRARVRRADDVATAVAAVLREHGARRVAVPADLPAAWRPPGVELVEDAALSPHALDALDGALTGCALAIAETGTIALDGGPGQGRRALSLVPDLHVCVVGAAQVVGTVPEALAALAGRRRPVTLVSGPSATSDIGFERVDGVHGPRRLEVLLHDWEGGR